MTDHPKHNRPIFRPPVRWFGRAVVASVAVGYVSDPQSFQRGVEALFTARFMGSNNNPPPPSPPSAPGAKLGIENIDASDVVKIVAVLAGIMLCLLATRTQST